MATSARPRAATALEPLEQRRLLCSVGDLPGISTSPLPDDRHWIHEATASTLSADSGSAGTLGVPAYSSRPSAAKKVYINFGGRGSISNWGGWLFGGKDVPATPAYDIDGDPNSFSAQELGNIEQIWKGVAEKFSPFDVDVTTVRPSSLNGAEVVVGGDGAWYGTGGGVAIIGYFGTEGFFDPKRPNVAFVWGAPMNTTYVAEAIAHEAGHTLGLLHQSLPPIQSNEYAAGFIMGSGDAGMGRWASSAVHGTIATRRSDDTVKDKGTQDDLAKIINKIPFRADDHGNTVATATSVSLVAQGGFQLGSTPGVIEQASDVDMFRISHPGGSLDVEILAAEFRPMFDPQLRLRNSAGTLLSTSTGNTGSDGLGEQIVFNNLNPGTYHIDVRGSGAYGDIGQYRLYIRAGQGTDASFNDTMGTATRLGQFGRTDAFAVAQGFAGTAVINDSLTTSDSTDFFQFRSPANTHRIHVRLSNLTTSARVALIEDLNGNQRVDGGEIISITGGGSGGQSFTFTQAAADKTYYVRVTRDSGAPSGNYTLRITADTAPAFLPPSVASATFDPQPLRGGKRAFDSIDALMGETTDYYRVTAEHSGLFSFYLFPQTPTGDLRLDVGIDANGNGTLQSTEILASSTNPGASSEIIQNLSVTAGQTLLIRVSAQLAGSSSNYWLQAMADYAVAGNTTGTLGGAFELTGHLAGAVTEYLDPFIDDYYDTFRINPASGTLTARINMTDGGSPHRLEIIRDANFNNVVDPGEIVATALAGNTLSHNVTPGANYYLRVSSVLHGEFWSVGNYRMTYASAGAVGQWTLDNPQVIVAGPNPLPATGYLGYDPDNPMITNRENFYRFTLSSRTRFDVSIDGPGMGVQVGRVVQSGNFQVFERLGGVGTFEGVVDSLNVNLDPGTYYVRAYLPVAERQDGMAGGNYVMFYNTAAITDSTPPLVTAAEFQYEIAPTGVIFTVNKDVFGSIDPDDVIVRNLATNQTYAIGETFYDPATRRIGYAFEDRVLPDGDYRATLKAGAVRDAAANPLPADVSFDFHVLAGDANRDRRVNLADFNILAANFGGSPKTFSQGDFNYDFVVNLADFNILAARFGAVLGPDGQVAVTPGLRLPAFGDSRIGMPAGSGDRDADDAQDLLA